MTTDMRTAAGSHDHQPQTLGFMPWMPAPVRTRRVDASVPKWGVKQVREIGGS
jgi:hypothetical protein